MIWCSDTESELERHDLAEFAKFGQASMTSQPSWRHDVDDADRRESAPPPLPPREVGGRARSEQRGQPPPFIEKDEVIDRLDRLENVVGKVCGVYQATMERFAQFAHPPQPKPGQPPQPEEAVPAPEPVKPAASAAAAGVEKLKRFEWDSLDLESTSGDAWADYHGREMWKAAEERRKKNPFNHLA